jgi:DNA-binding NtrC family response regulator
MRHDSPRTLLLIDDEPAQVRLVSAIAMRAGWRCVAAASPTDAPEALLRRDEGMPQAILVDRWGSGPGAGETVAALRSRFPAVPIVMLATSDAVDAAVEAMRAGAFDYLVKPIAPHRLLAAIDAAASGSETDSAGELRPLAEKLAANLGFDEIVGSAPAFRAALAVAAKAARARVPVLIDGESGVGKEVVAVAIHAASPRAKRAMVAVNCGAIPSNLVESELFGHERGAFTGAFERFAGRFGEADGGTIFLDEVGELPLDAQVKLLRVLETGEVQPLGSKTSRPVDVRVIAATNRCLADELAAGRFREDLYYRLNVVQVTLPPLRDRAGDIPALVRHLLDRVALQPGLRPLGITPEAMELLSAYRWPGNVRQLQNVLFRAALLCEGDALRRADFPQIEQALARPQAAAPRALAGPVPSQGGVTLFEANGHLRSLEAIEADVIRLAIGHYRGRMTEVARRLGIGRSTLYRKLGELGIDHAA